MVKLTKFQTEAIGTQLKEMDAALEELRGTYFRGVAPSLSVISTLRQSLGFFEGFFGIYVHEEYKNATKP